MKVRAKERVDERGSWIENTSGKVTRQKISMIARVSLNESERCIKASERRV